VVDCVISWQQSLGSRLNKDGLYDTVAVLIRMCIIPVQDELLLKMITELLICWFSFVK